VNETVYLFALSSPDLLQRILALPASPALAPSQPASTTAVAVVHAVRAA